MAFERTTDSDFPQPYDRNGAAIDSPLPVTPSFPSLVFPVALAIRTRLWAAVRPAGAFRHAL